MSSYLVMYHQVLHRYAAAEKACAEANRRLREVDPLDDEKYSEANRLCNLAQADRVAKYNVLCREQLFIQHCKAAETMNRVCDYENQQYFARQ